MGLAARLRALDDRVLGPARPSRYPGWVRFGGPPAYFALTGSVRVAEGAEVGSTGSDLSLWVMLGLGAGYLVATTVAILRGALAGTPAQEWAAGFWLLLGLAPLVLERGARTWPLVLLYAGVTAVGLALAWLALRRRHRGGGALG